MWLKCLASHLPWWTDPRFREDLPIQSSAKMITTFLLHCRATVTQLSTSLWSRPVPAEREGKGLGHIADFSLQTHQSGKSLDRERPRMLCWRRISEEDTLPLPVTQYILLHHLNFYQYYAWWCQSKNKNLKIKDVCTSLRIFKQHRSV